MVFARHAKAKILNYYNSEKSQNFLKSCIQICIFDDGVEVLLPRMFYNGLDLETAKTGESTCRNEAIAEVFHYMHFIEAWGTGIPRIINCCKEYGLSEPLFEEYGEGFKVTIFRKVVNAYEKVVNYPEKVVNGPKKVVNDTHKWSMSLKKQALHLKSIFRYSWMQGLLKNI